ncbi:MAG: phosphatidate cytidylyltransferase [Flavobacteriaceae bacterium]
MSKLLTRAVSGLLFALITISCILYNQFSAAIYLFALMLLCLKEFKRLLGYNSFVPYLISILLFLLNFEGNTHFFNMGKNIEKLIYAGLLALTLIEILRIFIKVPKSDQVDNIKDFVLSIAYIPIPFMLAYQIGFIEFHDTTYSPTLILLVFFMLWSNDSFAFLIGKNIGKTPLAPKVSPKKTIEGFAGGVFSTIAIALILSLWFLKDENFNIFAWIGLALIVSISGVIGDLIESYFKRRAGVKDSGNSIPGHGGFLDRLDSFIFATPFVYLYLTFIF